MNLTNKDFDTVIYHKDCPDGISSLWCVYHYVKQFENQYQYDIISMYAGIDPINDLTDKKIIFMDVCPSYNTLLLLSNISSSVTILDHHKSAYDMYLKNKETLDKISNLNLIFDMTKSGCQITWDYFFENSQRPLFIEYVADRDLWLWQLKNSKEINSAFDALNIFDASNFDQIDNLFESNDMDQLVITGKNINLYQKKLVDKQANQSLEAKMQVGDVEYYVNVGTINHLVSELGNELTKKVTSENIISDFAVIWNYNLKEKFYYISLRGHNLSPDLSKIAKHFGGGGHATAAGFRISNIYDILEIV